MNVLQFSTYTTGGAAIAARRLHASLLRQGVESRFAHCPPAGAGLDGTYTPMFSKTRKWQDVLDRFAHTIPRPPFAYSYLRKRPMGFEQFSFPSTSRICSLDLKSFPADILSLHYIAGWIDYPSFFASVPDDLPIVWTLHDMNPFTGGCHYSWECEKYKTGCHTCFQLNDRRGPRDISNRFFNLKRKLLARKNIHIVADSRWLESQARQSPMLAGARSFQTIHYGLDTKLFRPKDRRLCKSLLDIPDDAFVVCFGAETLNNRRKGFAQLQEALSLLPQSSNIVCLLFGAAAPESVRGFPVYRVTGPIASIELQTIIYSAADLYVIPSLHEAFGLTSLEAMACGVPVAGFETGGIPDMITPFENGLLAKAGSVRALADAIMYMLEHPQQCAEMGRRARETVLTKFTGDRQAENYIEFFEKILSKAPV